MSSPQLSLSACVAASLMSLPAASSDEPRTASTHDLVVTRTFNSSLERVWRAWSEAGEIAKWWGPKGFTATVPQFDFREGGVTLVCMRAPEGPGLCNTWTYRRIVPNSRIEFDFGWSDAAGREVSPATLGLPEGLPRVVPHAISLRSLPDGTEMVYAEFGYASEQMAEGSRLGLVEVLDKFEASLR